MKSEWQNPEHGGEQHPDQVFQRRRRTGEWKAAPAHEQGGDESKGQHPQESAPYLLRADEPNTENRTGPVGDGTEEKAENEEGDDKPGHELRPAIGANVGRHLAAYFLVR